MIPVLSAMIASMVTFSLPSAFLIPNKSRTASRVPLPSSRVTTEMGRFELNVLAAVADTELTAGELFAGELLAGELLAGELLAGELLAGELLAGELFAGLLFPVDELLLLSQAASIDSANKQASKIAQTFFILIISSICLFMLAGVSCYNNFQAAFQSIQTQCKKQIHKM